jgi:hypothetical protein
MKVTFLVGLAFLANVIVNTAVAHHGAFEYDLSTVLEYEGAVIEHRWKNPHNLIVLETESESGEPLRLEIEGGGPSALRTVGVTADSIVVGEQVTAVVSPSRRFPNRFAYGREIIKADGSVVPLGPGNSSAGGRETRETASSIFGTWTASLGSFQGLLGARASWVFTDEGQTAFDSYSPAMSSQRQCISVSAPWLMVHPVVHEIEPLEDRIVIRTDWLGGVERTIYLDGRPHPPVTERLQQGHSVGRWEDNVLVVDTTNFTDRIYAGLASSGGKHLVERWSLSEDGKSLDYSFVLEDPEYLAESVSGTYQWNYRPDLEPSGIECDLELAERYLREFQ